jgi:hypothetical protein
MRRRGIPRRTLLKAGIPVAIAAVSGAAGFPRRAAAAANAGGGADGRRRNPAIRHINGTIPPFEFPKLRGTSYRAEVPDTLDLAEMSRSAVEGLANICDDDNNAEMFWRTEFGWRRPLMVHEGFDWCEFKSYAPSILMRQACGSDYRRDVEWHRMANLLQMQGPDGLVYLPTAGRPWAEDYGTDAATNATYGAGKGPGGKRPEFVMPLIPAGRIIEAAATYHQLTGEQQWKRLAENAVRGLDKLAVHRDGCAFFHKATFVPGERAGSTDAPFPPAAVHHQQIWTALGAIACHRMTGFEPALDLGYHLARFFSLGHSKFIGPAGEFRANHILDREPNASDPIHFHTNSLLRILLLQAGVAKGDREMIDLARAGYAFGKTRGEASMGFFPEHLNVKPEGYGNTCELCCAADMTTLALLQSTTGVADCWDDVDRWVRNVLCESQLRDVDWVPRLIAASEQRGEHKYAHASTDRVPQRMRGLWAGWLAPNDWQGNDQYSGVACCWGNAGIALTRAFREMIAYDAAKKRLSLHLLANRASQWADIDSHIPSQGRVVVRCKFEGQLALRLPAWAKKSEVTLDDKPATPRTEGRYVVIDRVRPGSRVTLDMPIPEDRRTVTIAAKQYTLTIRGHDVVDIDPPGKWRPIFTRPNLRKPQAATRVVQRFVVDSPIGTF